ncbi:hypothetical protein Pcinc_020572 [Petrolisthes cinctipes]|uniref:Uncharacterized protein n=1 Tax=Petrolisthes cinctipes TaxID=88211 RepID=A0AAE1FIU8_PETCI|nr:hypothetical protein Pcinc_020572 [Petrolisthes cinctipes]
MASLNHRLLFRMLWAGLVTLAAVGAAAQDRMPSRPCYHHPSSGDTIYDFEEADLFKTKNISMEDYEERAHTTVYQPCTPVYQPITTINHPSPQSTNPTPQSINPAPQSVNSVSQPTNSDTQSTNLVPPPSTP